MLRRIFHIVLVVVCFVLTSCATYYEKTRDTERALVVGNYDDAKQKILDSKFLNRKRNLLLFNLEMGKICHLRGEFEESNKYFNEADRMMGEYRNAAEVAVGLTVNPAMQPYQAERHEQIMIHYYKALNYLRLGNMEEAIVEVRRLDLKEEAMNVAAKGKENKYSQDAFGLMLMGMIYEADGDYNNAFIAYRNAKLAYEADETGLYSGKEPSSLAQDIVRCAKFSGIGYESDVTYDANHAPNGELILFYESGLSPVKAEKNYFFSLNENEAGFFFQSGSIIVPTDFDFSAGNPNFDPADLGILRLAFPYYVNRTFTTGSTLVEFNGQTSYMENGQDISALAFQVEKDNFIKNLAKDLVRLALKKIAELAVARQNEYAGAALGITNAVTEKADTRNWQTLPGKIEFLRIPLAAGANAIEVTGPDGAIHTLTVEGNGGIVFRNICAY
jgi:uncharacterized protein